MTLLGQHHTVLKRSVDSLILPQPQALCLQLMPAEALSMDLNISIPPPKPLESVAWLVRLRETLQAHFSKVILLASQRLSSVWPQISRLHA